MTTVSARLQIDASAAAYPLPKPSEPKSFAVMCGMPCSVNRTVARYFAFGGGGGRGRLGRGVGGVDQESQRGQGDGGEQGDQARTEHAVLNSTG